MKTLIRNISSLVGILPEGKARLQGEEMGRVEEIRDAYLLIEDGKIASFGKETDLPEGINDDDDLTLIDAEGGMVMPSFCDSHTHIVYAGSREGEFLDKIKGLSYEQIAANGGGILNSADLLHSTSEEDLYKQASARVDEMIRKGTGAIEIKSGYGLRTEDELTMLRVIRRIKENTPAIVKATFLGAHAVGRGYTMEDYVEAVCEEMIPAVAAEGLADYIDVFCDKGFFSPEDTEKILRKGMEYGLVPKIHANELDVSGGVQVGVKCGALSVDHLERTTDEEIGCLKGTDTMPTMLPGSSSSSGSLSPG